MRSHTGCSQLVSISSAIRSLILYTIFPGSKFTSVLVYFIQLSKWCSYPQHACVQVIGTSSGPWRESVVHTRSCRYVSFYRPVVRNQQPNLYRVQTRKYNEKRKNERQSVSKYYFSVPTPDELQFYNKILKVLMNRSENQNNNKITKLRTSLAYNSHKQVIIIQAENRASSSESLWLAKKNISTQRQTSIGYKHVLSHRFMQSYGK
ncbi:Hypothetical_protein [Hexamita inflata]|uniref:Hypothetical_protein n=1 Tax=Hexamita inflata TaxID=28002 RepID=A0AA86R693_9EUKA|nr:Hypothetical protein HINF_LOCUS55631 [Hexamita inflata]